jgi:hypothetical protein
MTDIPCNYPDRDEQLVAYLYDDIDSAERTAFGLHLSACRQCHDDLSALRGVRTALGTWAPPEPAFATRGLRASSPEPRGASREPRVVSLEPRVASPEPRVRWWHDVPAWAQVAAALFVLGVSATIANLDVRYDNTGLTIRTGWSRPQPAAPAAAANAAPWRAEFAALQNQLRAEMKASQAAVTAASSPAAQAAMSDADFRRRVRALLDDSERKQQTELAFRLAEFQNDINAQRQADLTRTNEKLGFIQRDTYGELLKQRQGMDYLLKVSQKQ